MKISTMSVVVGTGACNAVCPYCVSKMTPVGANDPRQPINTRNLLKALLFAERSGVSTILLTGKGEPTLFPKDITTYLTHICKNGRFPFIEMQTNGFVLDSSDRMDSDFKAWYDQGLTTVSVSIVSTNPFKNGEIMKGNNGGPTETARVVKKLHDFGFSVRINCTMLKGVVDSWQRVKETAHWCSQHKVEQLTIRDVTAPERTEDPKVSSWVKAHNIGGLAQDSIKSGLEKEAVPLLRLPHGAVIYDLDGQNICFNNCLTHPESEEIRQIIFFPDGHLRYDWVYDGAILL